MYENYVQVHNPYEEILEMVILRPASLELFASKEPFLRRMILRQSPLKLFIVKLCLSGSEASVMYFSI